MWVVWKVLLRVDQWVDQTAALWECQRAEQWGHQTVALWAIQKAGYWELLPVERKAEL